MSTLPLISQVSLYLLLAMIGLMVLVIGVWQYRVLRGESLKNPDGSHDDWHAQKAHYGMAFADVFVVCPVTLAGIGLVLAGSRWGFYLLTLSGAWLVWGNVMTTANSLRFEKPRIDLVWLVTFPLGGLIGLAWVVWTAIHFDRIFLP
jgi:divalent metal cation (Fe/Co/Zn/Cd) transporter